MNFVVPKIHRLGGNKMLYVYNEAVQKAERRRKIYRASFARASAALNKRSEFCNVASKILPKDLAQNSAD